MDQKRFVLKDFKAEDTGTFEAVFATLNVIDHDDDRILKGAIGAQEVIISAYGHGSWNGALPVGKGKVSERNNEGIVKGSFFLDTEGGKETYLTIKNLAELQEWSFALPEMDWQMVEEDGRHIREIKRVKINEVSPVLMGSGIDTRTLAVKSKEINKDEQIASKRFVDHIDETVEAVEKVVSRATKIRALRDAEGGEISHSSLRRLKVLRDAMAEALVEIDQVIKKPPDLNAEAQLLAVKFEEARND